LAIAQNKLEEMIIQLNAANTSLSTLSEESLQRETRVIELEEQLAKIAAGPQVADLLAELGETKSSGAAGMSDWPSNATYLISFQLWLLQTRRGPKQRLYWRVPSRENVRRTNKLSKSYNSA
jgi:hypothetical protein